MAWVYAYYVLAVGQGTGTLVQVCKDTLDKPVWNVIIDLGSRGWKRTVGLPSAKFAAERMKKGKQPGGAVTLDAVILSHSDSDHSSLLSDLLAEFTKPTQSPTNEKPNLTINKVWFGGDRSKYVGKGGTNLLEVLNEYRPDKVKSILVSPANNSSSFDKDPPTRIVDSEKEAWIWLLIGNTICDQVSFDGNKPTRTAEEGYATNTMSLVVGVTFGVPPHERQIIATGDATGLTILKCRQVIKDRDLNLKKSLSVTLPHHGSATSAYDLRGLKASRGSSDDLAKENIKGFSEDLEAESISASAGEHGNYNQPAIEVIGDFGEYVGKGKFVDKALWKQEEHFYTFYTSANYFSYIHKTKWGPVRWPGKDGWRSARTNKNVFTTDYFIGEKKQAVPTAWPTNAYQQVENASAFHPKPPRTISWAFVVKDGGANWTVERVVDKARLGARELASLEAIVGTPLPEERFVHIPSADAEG